MAAPLAGVLDGALVGLRAAVGEEDLVEAAVLDEKLGELELRDGVELVGGLDECPRLLRYGLGQDGVGVADVRDGPAGREVEVFVALVVPNPRALSPHEDDGLAVDDVQIVLAFDVLPIGHIIDLPE